MIAHQTGNLIYAKVLCETGIIYFFWNSDTGNIHFKDDAGVWNYKVGG